MPKHTRTTSSSHNRYPMPVSLAPAATPTAMYAQRLSIPTAALPTNSLPHAFYPTVPSSGPSASMQNPQSSYDPYGTAVGSSSIPNIPQHRASSGAWTPQDDQTLLQARAQGLNWGQIQMTYFASKTPNACRKRHERLMERKGADDWDARKMEQMAKEYMSMRKEIWSGLAARTGEKWNVVEQKCMSNGLKNLQSAARSAARRERLESGQPMNGYDDDSGISGIGLTPVDDLDASYSSPETTASGGAHSVSGSSTASAAAGYHGAYHTGSQHAYGHAASGYGYSGNGAHHGYTSSVSSTGTGGYGGHGGHSHSQSSSPYLSHAVHGQRLPSVDMNIGSLINQPGGGAPPSV